MSVQEKRQCVDVWLDDPLVIVAQAGIKPNGIGRGVQKIKLWLTDPLIIEAHVFVPPENTRIVRLDNPPAQSNSDRDNTGET